MPTSLMAVPNLEEGMGRKWRLSKVQGAERGPQPAWSAAGLNLNSILKGRDINLPTKVHLVKAMVFPVVLYGRESWTIKKAECPRIDTFELWCWRRLLRGKEEKGTIEDEMVGIQPVYPKGDRSWVFTGRTDAEAETPILGPPYAKN